MKTGIIYHADRLFHPYTVWVKGEVVKFCAGKQEAELELRRTRGMR